MLVKGQAAIVTGAASGLGEATARMLAAAGANVAVLDLNGDRATAVATDIGGIGIGCDVTDAASAEAAVDQAGRSFGPARILVNCAGIAPAARVVGRAGPMNLNAFRSVIEVNLIGSFNLVRLVAAHAAKLEPLADGERAVLISTASIAAYEGQVGQAAYAASKAGVVGMILPIARELASVGIRVCAIAPGIFGTPMVRAMPEPVQQSLAAGIPFPSRLGSPEEFASLALYIVGNVMLNGEVIRLDGALRMAAK